LPYLFSVHRATGLLASVPERSVVLPSLNGECIMARGNKFILSEVSFGPEILKLLSEAVHVNAMIAVVEAEAVAAAPKLRDWLISLVAFARRAADRLVGVVFVIS
jgi:hypothetical protein